jgi:hypothetical protein
MLKKIHNKIFLDLLKMPHGDSTSLQIISDRLSKCRQCNHWYETKYDYKCFKCGCVNNILLKFGKCPLKTPKW